MAIFTYVTLVLTIIGILLMFIPQKWYTKSKINWLAAGMWLAAFSVGTLAVVWLICLINSLIQFLFPLIIILWGNAG